MGKLKICSMKKFILLIGFSFVFIAAKSQELDCSKVKSGVFKSVLNIDGEEFITIISREKNKQIEENKGKGIKMEFVVKWTSSCTYELSKPKVISGEVPDVLESHILYVKITGITKELYSTEVTSNFFEEKILLDFLIINKD